MEESIVMLVRSNKMIDKCDVIKENVCNLGVTKHDEHCTMGRLPYNDQSGGIIQNQLRKNIQKFIHFPP